MSSVENRLTKTPKNVEALWQKEERRLEREKENREGKVTGGSKSTERE